MRGWCDVSCADECENGNLRWSVRKRFLVPKGYPKGALGWLECDEVFIDDMFKHVKKTPFDNCKQNGAKKVEACCYIGQTPCSLQVSTSSTTPKKWRYNLAVILAESFSLVAKQSALCFVHTTCRL